MSDFAIAVESLGKCYRIGPRESYQALRDVITDAVARPFRRVRAAFEPTRSAPAAPDHVWALKDVSFQIRPGEVVGIIGRNGAGKSTLLKILSRITDPTEGHAHIRGRVGSLLEVGTGFHPELTGRENIYLSGAILGMRREEIDRRLDEIVEFSGVERFLDTPMKRFSSGMQMRLAFSVAAHLQADVLLVDEVLAVGDAEFQKKCLGRMQSLTGEGRTVLLVSHNMSAIRTLCQRALLIDAGRLVFDGAAEKAVATYLDANLADGAVASWEAFEGRIEGFVRRHNPSIRLREVAIVDESGFPRNTFQSEEEIHVVVTYECLTDINDLRVVVQVVDEDNRPILTTQSADDAAEQKFYRRLRGVYRSSCAIPANTFGEKRLYVSTQLLNPKVEHLVLNKVLAFEVRFTGYNNDYGAYRDAYLRPPLQWKTEGLACPGLTA